MTELCEVFSHLFFVKTVRNVPAGTNELAHQKEQQVVMGTILPGSLAYIRNQIPGFYRLYSSYPRYTTLLRVVPSCTVFDVDVAFPSLALLRFLSTRTTFSSVSIFVPSGEWTASLSPLFPILFQCFDMYEDRPNQMVFVSKFYASTTRMQVAVATTTGRTRLLVRLYILPLLNFANIFLSATVGALTALSET